VAFGRAAVAAAFAAADRPPSMAELQSYLLMRKHDRGAALRDAHELALVLTCVGRFRKTVNEGDEKVVSGRRDTRRGKTLIVVREIEVFTE
jgi:hypothetical protein